MTEGSDVDIPAAWHPDPLGRYEYRYWDGQRWTEHVANQGIAGVDATGLEPPAAAAQQTGGWDSSAGQQPAGEQPGTGWVEDPNQAVPAAQQPASDWQQPADGSTVEPEPAQAAAAGDRGDDASAADDPDHWQRPWTTAAVTSGSETAAATGTDQPAATAGPDEGDPDHWQRPWAASPSTGTTPVGVDELETEPADRIEPSAASAASDELGADLPDWQRPWEESGTETVAQERAAAAAAPTEGRPEMDTDHEVGDHHPGQDLEPGSEATDVARGPATVEEASELDEVIRAAAAVDTAVDDDIGPEHDAGPDRDDDAGPDHDEGADADHDAVHAPAATSAEPAADDTPHWRQPWTSSSPTA